MESAAAALAQLHQFRAEPGWDSEQVCHDATATPAHHAIMEGFIDNDDTYQSFPKQDAYGSPDPFRKSQSRRARFAPLLNDDPDIFDEDQFIHPDLGGSGRPPGLMPSSLARSPPGRSSTLPPTGPRPIKYGPNRPRKNSVGQNARKPKHERTRSKELQKRFSHERKAFSAEPQAAVLGKRWEDLIDAAASATEEDIREREDSRDRTPTVRYQPIHCSVAC